MSYQEKKTIVSIISGTLLLAAYCIYIFSKYRSHMISADNISFCGITMLIFLGIGIAAIIIIQILFHIALSIGIAVKDSTYDKSGLKKEFGLTVAEDEMDKLIELKALKAGFIIGGSGFVVSLFSAVLNYPAAVVLNIIFLSFGLGTLAKGVVSLHYYRKGIKNG